MSSDISSKRSDMIAKEAAEYFVALHAPDAKTKVEFIDWLKVSPEHVSEFLAVAALWDSLPEVSAQPSAEELIQLAAGDQNVVALGQLGCEAGDSASGLPMSSAGSDLAQGRGAAGDLEQSPPPRRSAGRRPLQSTRVPRLWAAAASIVCAIAATALYIKDTAPEIYSTRVGELTSIPLPDGSIVTLNTQSTMRVSYSEAYRVIHLTEGEALFEVSKNPARPFRVITGSAVIQAVGTQFNVRSVAEDVTVTVVEGIVDVSAKPSRSPSGQVARLPDTGETEQTAAVIEPVRLTVGQQARIEPESGQVAVVDATVEKTIAWQQRRLVFEHLSLEEVIDEFNRYNDPPIVIDDPELRSLPINGVFRSNDRESFMQFLAQMQLAESHTRADGTIVLRRAVQE